ncbi:mitogen-activated protein kinase kinase 7, isoform CRA_a [Homo sapiens]|nr:mitogen-activated protein kinase kinase 7, isoform CRA_a [Homo sapiens]
MAASSLEQKLSRLEAKLKQENREARRRIDLNLDISPQRPRPRTVWRPPPPAWGLVSPVQRRSTHTRTPGSGTPELL